MNKTKRWINQRKERYKRKRASKCIGCTKNHNGWCNKVGDWCHLVSYCSKGAE